MSKRKRRPPIRDHHLADIMAGWRAFRGNKQQFCLAMGLGYATFNRIQHRWKALQEAENSPKLPTPPQRFAQASRAAPVAMLAPAPPAAPPPAAPRHDPNLEGLMRENAMLKRLLAEAWRLTAVG